VLIPAAVAAGVAAAGYAATKAAPKVKQAAPKLKEKVTSRTVDAVEDTAESALDQAEDRGGVTGFVAGMTKKKSEDGDGGDGMLSKLASPFGGGRKEPSEGWGKGRRNPIQLSADVAVPIEIAYDQWTQLEEFPKFMHRVTSVKQDEDDPSKVKWQEKIWFSSRDWEAEITEQIPNERIAWRTVSGTKHVGHVTFHRLDDSLTRVIVNIDFQPSGLIEKMGSGFRFVKRAAKSDLYRYKAFIETHREPTGAWRGRIEEGEVVEDPGVEEGKPIEEGAELRRPESREEKEKERESEEGPSAEADGDDDADRELRRAEREERRRARNGEREGEGAQSEEREQTAATS
jgi:uncharacterized membrane protein